MNNDSPVYDVSSSALKVHTNEEDRPREKALKHGFDHLTIPELMAILLGSGTRGENVVQLCDRIMRDHNHKLYEIARKGVKGLMKYRGIGQVKAIEIMAALEIARRYQLEKYEHRFQVTCSRDAYNYLGLKMQDLDHEEFWVMLLDRNKHVLSCERVSSGGTSMTVADVKMILKPAIEQLADGIIIAHNHPSDNPHPSAQDNALTAKVKRGCEALDVQLLDHIIVCRGGLYYSYNDDTRL